MYGFNIAQTFFFVFLLTQLKRELYMKKIILTMLMSAVFAQNCNKNNWRDYYNSDGKDMSDCDLRWAQNLKYANLRRSGATLTGSFI